MELDLEAFGAERFYQLFNYTSAQAEVDQGFPLFRQLALDPSLELIPKKLST